MSRSEIWFNHSWFILLTIWKYVHYVIMMGFSYYPPFYLYRTVITSYLILCKNKNELNIRCRTQWLGSSPILTALFCAALSVSLIARLRLMGTKMKAKLPTATRWRVFPYSSWRGWGSCPRTEKGSSSGACSRTSPPRQKERHVQM